MFGSIGGPELIVILVVALLIFGPRKLPQIGRTLGKGLAELRRASTDLKSTLDREIRLEDRSSKDARPRPAAGDEERLMDTLTEAGGGEDSAGSMAEPADDDRPSGD